MMRDGRRMVPNYDASYQTEENQMKFLRRLCERGKKKQDKCPAETKKKDKQNTTINRKKTKGLKNTTALFFFFAYKIK